MEENSEWWRFFDGSVSVSASMLAAVLLSRCAACEGLPLLWLLYSVVVEDNGIIVAATLLLFPMTLTLYGGTKLIFAAKKAVERETRERMKRQRAEGRAEGVKEGRAEGVKEGRKGVLEELMEQGVITPELAKSLEDAKEE